MKRSLLVRAGEALAPDAFQLVLESESDTKGKGLVIKIVHRILLYRFKHKKELIVVRGNKWKRNHRCNCKIGWESTALLKRCEEGCGTLKKIR